jgi:hypothetical protein
LQAGKSVRVIAKVMGKTRDCVRIKIARSNIEVVVPPINQARTTTSNRFKGLLLRGSSR